MRRAAAWLVALLLAGAVGGLAASSVRSPVAGAVAGPPDLTTAPIVRTTLTATQPITGHIEPRATWSLRLPDGSSPAAVVDARAAVASATDALAASRAGLTTAERVRSLVAAGDRAVVRAATGSAAIAAARRQVQLDSAQQDLAVDQARVAVSTAARSLASGQLVLAEREASEATTGSTVTATVTLGAAVGRGDVLWAVDGAPTVFMVGAAPAFRAMREGDTGTDVAQLQSNLVALGFGSSPVLRTDGTFDPATAAAVAAWQQSRRVAATGVVRLGDVVFLPSVGQVASVALAPGAAAVAASPAIELASAERIAAFDVAPGLAGALHVRDAIRLTLPGGREATGRVATVAAVATAAGSPGTPGSTGAQLSVRVTATVDDQAGLAGLGRCRHHGRRDDGDRHGRARGAGDGAGGAGGRCVRGAGRRRRDDPVRTCHARGLRPDDGRDRGRRARRRPARHRSRAVTR